MSNEREKKSYSATGLLGAPNFTVIREQERDLTLLCLTPVLPALQQVRFLERREQWTAHRPGYPRRFLESDATWATDAV